MIFLCLFLCSFSGNSYVTTPNPDPTSETQAQHIKLALLLDTSSSMDGLIEQTKSQLWEIVNTLAKAKKNGDFAKLDISLYQYGNSRLHYSDGYIEQILPLTNDLDDLSESLFNLTTSGGNEYCGEVIMKSAKDLEWNKNGEGLNLIFIAGNEPFTQGKVDYSSATKFASEAGIIVNTIYCGDQKAGINGKWKDGAILAGGNYANLDMNQVTQYVETPYDQQIADLNASLNNTYIPYGKMGQTKLAKQVTQDNNSKVYGVSNMVNRTVSKSSHLYDNSTWDLVDANTNQQIDVADLEDEDLPSEMQDMDQVERQIYIAKKTAERNQIKDKIAELSRQREAYIKSQQNNNVNGLNSALLQALKAQARTRGFSFDEDISNLYDLDLLNPAYQDAYVDFDFFEQVSTDAKAHRSERLVTFAQFIRASKEPNTIILDTRSKAMYDRMHIKGAIHLNFSDFNQLSLANVIPSKDTKVLIYCNNNFTQERLFAVPFITKAAPPATPVGLTTSGVPNTLALNIPTYINLYGYGYKNVYELKELVSTSHKNLKLEGTDVPNNFNTRFK